MSGAIKKTTNNIARPKDRVYKFAYKASNKFGRNFSRLFEEKNVFKKSAKIPTDYSV